MRRFMLGPTNKRRLSPTSNTGVNRLLGLMGRFVKGDPRIGAVPEPAKRAPTILAPS